MTIKTFVAGTIATPRTFTVADSDVEVYGGTLGYEIVKIQSAASLVTLDANVEQVELSGALSTYKFVVVSGTGLQIQNSSGTVIATLPNINQNVKVVFADGSATLAQSGTTAFTLGSVTIVVGATGAAATVSTTLTTFSVSNATGDAAAITTAFAGYSGTAATVDATGLDASQMAVVATNAAKIAAGGITGTVSLSNSQFTTLTTALNASATLTVTDTSLAATALTAMDTKATPAVVASGVMTITGTAAEVAAVAGAAGITKATNFAATLSGTTNSVTDANTIDANTVGVITGTLTADTITSFTTLTGTGNAYAVTVSDAATIAQLSTLDAKTTGTVTANIVSDTLTNLTTNTGGYVIAGKAATVTDAATIAQLTTLDALANVGTVTANIITDNVTTMVTNTGSYVTSPTIATFQFATDTAAQAIASFTLSSDKIDLNALTTETVTTTLTGSLTPTVDKVYFLASTLINADTLGETAVAVNAAATLANSTATSYIVITDANSTSIYKWVDTGSDECKADGTELTLMGTVDAVLTTSDLFFA